MKPLALFITMILTTSVYAFEGIYDVKGYDPYLKKNYEGGAVITKDQNGVYQARWTSEGKQYIGTGLKSDNELSFIFITPGEKDSSGVQIYKIEGNILKGSWVYLGKSLIGTETLTPKPAL